MARPTDSDRYDALKSAVADIGLIRRGTLLRRFMPCGKSGCRCQADPPRLHGPYFQWTRKVRGKTVTVRVPPEEAGPIAEWIENGRRLLHIVGELERVAERLTERALRAARTASSESASGDRRDRPTQPRSPSPRRRKPLK